MQLECILLVLPFILLIESTLLQIQRQMLRTSQRCFSVKKSYNIRRPSGVRWRRFASRWSEESIDVSKSTLRIERKAPWFRFTTSRKSESRYIRLLPKSIDNEWSCHPLHSPWQPIEDSVISKATRGLRVGQVVPVEVLLVRHTYDVVWQDTGMLETGVEASRLDCCKGGFLGSAFFMPGDKVIRNTG